MAVISGVVNQFFDKIMAQVAYSFDSETVRKIIKGFGHSVMVTVLFMALDTIMQLLGLVHFNDPMLAGLFALVSQNAYNVVREYIAGK